MPFDANLKALSDYFHVPVEELLADKEKPASPARDGLTEKQIELLGLIPDLTDEEAAVLLASAKAQLENRKARGGSK